MSKSDPPQPPNPQATAAAQTGTNVSTAIANSFLNNTNQITPLGSLSYDQTGTYSFTDPSNGQVYNIPRFTATQQLTDQSRAIQDETEAAKFNLSGLANTQSARVGSLLSNDIDLSQAGPFGDPSQISGIPRAATQFGDAGNLQMDPGAYNALATQFGQVGPLQSGYGGHGQYQLDPGQYQSLQLGFGDAGQQALQYGGQGQYQLDPGQYQSLQFGFGDVGSQQGQFGGTPGSVFGFGGAGDVTRNYGPQDDFSSDRQRVEQSLFSRLAPQLERERTNLEQRLADQGIRYGSTAYNDAMKDYNDRAAAQQVAVTQAGGAEQQRMMDMAAQRAGFQNAAQQQEYQQQRGRGEFFNTAEQQAFQEAATRGQFGNAAQQAAYLQAQGRGEFANRAAIQTNQDYLAYQEARNKAQAAQAAEAQQRGAFGNVAQQAAYQQALGRGQFTQQANIQANQDFLAYQQARNQAQAAQADEAAKRAGFANAAQQAEYEQALGRGQFGQQATMQTNQDYLAYQSARNQAQAATFQQAALRGQFAQSGLAQQLQQAQAGFTAQNAARAQYLQEQYALRNQPINEISALLSGSQVQQPSFVNTPQQQIPTTDISGLINQNFAQQFQNYQSQQQAQNQLLGGILGAAGSIGAGFAFRSDRRAKEDITRVGSVFAMEPNTGAGERKTLPIYEYSYKDDPASTRHVGPMAQDVEKIDKGAVTSIGGVKHIYPERVMGSILRAA